MPSMRVGDIQLYYEIHGDGQPVLLVHGLGSSGLDWEAQVDALSQHYRVITVDLRGHGRSDRPAGPYDMRMFSEDVAGLLLALNTGAVHLVGLSLGGVLAFQLAVDHPALIRSLTIVNSAPELIPRTRAQRFSLWQRRSLIRWLGLRPFGRILGKRLFPDPANAGQLATFEQRFADNSKGPYLAALDAVMSWSASADIGKIRCPVLVVAADQDYSPVSVKEEYVRRLPDARLVVIPDSHHALPVERPAIFNQTLMEFLAAR